MKGMFGFLSAFIGVAMMMGGFMVFNPYRDPIDGRPVLVMVAGVPLIALGVWLLIKDSAD